MSTAPYTIERYDTERDWLKARLRGVGASEASAIVGLSGFCSPFGLYFRKREGRVEDDGEPLGEMREAGHRHERTIADWFLEQSAVHGVTELRDPGDYTIYRSKERPHMFATLDREAPATLTEGIRPVEFKCGWYESARTWQERVPISYQCQAQQQLYVTGADEMFFAALLNGYQFRWYRMERHERFIKRLCDRIDQFWERVEKRQPPPVDGHSSTLRALFEQHPKDNGQAVELPSELAEQAMQLWDEEAKEAARIAKRKDELKAQIQALMGDARYAVCPDGSGFRWSRDGKKGRFERVTEVRSNDVAA